MCPYVRGISAPKLPLGLGFSFLNFIIWVLREACCKKDPCNFKKEVLVSKVGNPCPNPSQLLASRILYVLLLGDKQNTRVAQKLVNSWSIPHQLLIPWEVAGVFLVVVLWQHPMNTHCGRQRYIINPKTFLHVAKLQLTLMNDPEIHTCISYMGKSRSHVGPPFLL